MRMTLYFLRGGMPLLLALAIFPPVAVAMDGQFKAPDSLIVHFSDTDLPAVSGSGARFVRPGAMVVPLSSETWRRGSATKRQLNGAMKAWRQRANVVGVEPNYHGRFADVVAAPLPNDPRHDEQWWLERIGVRQLWPVGKGEGIKVAVIDSGVQRAHPDLQAALEPDGHDFGDDDADPEDRLGHGTGVAGVIAAATDNGLGISGVAPAARILPIKISPDADPVFSTEALVRAIDYAVAKGARIINLSLVVEQETRLLRDAIQAALDHGVMVVAAAGNDGGTVAFPANMSGVVAVAATDRNDRLMSDSNRGSAIAIAAPGEQILTADLDGGYSLRQGTSFAAPMVTATLSALQSANPSVPPQWALSLLALGGSVVAGQRFRVLGAGQSAQRAIPRVIPTSSRWTTSELFTARYELPPYPTPVDIYVAVSTPAGDIVLRPDCGWASLYENGFSPMLSAYRADEAADGPLFDVGSPCPAIPLGGLPGGRYIWHVGAVIRANGELLGAVDSYPVDISD